MDFLPPQVVEDQALASNDNDKSHCLVVPSNLSIGIGTDKILVNVKAGKHDVVDNDESTARTEISTEIDEMSLREKISSGSLYLSNINVGTCNSQASSFDASRIASVRSKQSDLLSIAKPKGSKNTQSDEFENHNKSLFDMDDDDDASIANGIDMKTALLRETLSNESQVDFYGGDQSNYTYAGSIIQDTMTSESRTDFYSGYNNCPTFASVDSFDRTPLHNSESRADFYGTRRSSGLMFPDGTLNTDLNTESPRFYTVGCSDTEEPLSCHQKLEQPALSCDESIWHQTEEEDEIKGEEQKSESTHNGEDWSGSIFSAVTCCFMPAQS
eukprot:CAMPEP_0181092716 /NCGR_PEP_ID=MMETSP1071-20121207/9063_1 /TAXON_ID=35127 /ORGANISM="Thalassiosira sp., Strain NH16" /LENGTH=327 /DNA_ID=CAMNT_0023174907 /DNA_START=32 /DNA_END=1015 /DNA_ORIENTATION=+